MNRFRNNLFVGFLLITIFFIALFFRTVSLNTTPAGFTWDEAALGYNAYSLLRTGKDEYGEVLPLILKSFGDYKPAFYAYIAIPAIAILGLNEFAVRLPSILFGSLLSILVFFICKKLFDNGKDSIFIGLIASFFVSISAWLIPFSRGAWESNIAVFLNLLALYFFLKARERVVFFVISFFLFSLAIYTYQSSKLFTFMLALGLLLIFWKKFSKKIRWLNIGALIVLLIVIGSSIADPVARSRLEVLNQYGYKRSVEELDQLRKEGGNENDLVFSIFHSHDLEYIRTVSGRYINYFSPKFLFFDALVDGRQGVIGYGTMHLFQLPFFIAGIFFMIRKVKVGSFILLLWMIIAPIPAALSRDSVSLVRALPLSIGLEIIAAVGLYELVTRVKLSWLRFSLGIGLAVIVILNLGYFFDRYFIHSRIHSSEYWLHGHKEVIKYVHENMDKYDKVVFTSKFNQPYIFYLFYTKYDPALYQSESRLIQNGVDVGSIDKIGKIEFRPLYWPNDRSVKNSLYVGSWLEIPDQDIDPKQSRLLKIIYFLDTSIAFKVAETL